MPTPEQIQTSLSEIANTWQLFAILWHLYFTVLAVGLIKGARPTRRFTGILLILPLLSVSVLAWLSGNPFSGIVFASSGAALFCIALRLPTSGVRIAPRWAVVPGLLLVIFGWGYPHFLDTASLLPYIYAAPTGLIPCPTLSIVIGFSLLLGRLGSRAWSLILVTMGILYGLLGALYLSLALDWVLLIGALILVIAEFSHKRGKRAAADEDLRYLETIL
jgi:hypothetical protein